MECDEDFHFISLFCHSARSDTELTHDDHADHKERNMSQKSDMDNHANQLNHNNDAYWQSRGYDERPEDWEDLI